MARSGVAFFGSVEIQEWNENNIKASGGLVCKGGGCGDL